MEPCRRICPRSGPPTGSSLKSPAAMSRFLSLRRPDHQADSRALADRPYLMGMRDSGRPAQQPAVGHEAVREVLARKLQLAAGAGLPQPDRAREVGDVFVQPDRGLPLRGIADQEGVGGVFPTAPAANGR